MTSFARIVIRFRWPILVAWLIAAAVLLVTAPFGSAFSDHGNSNPLPTSAPSQRADALIAQHFQNDQSQSTTFTHYTILVDPRGIQPADQSAVAGLASNLQSAFPSTVLVKVGPIVPSQDGKALMLPLTWDGAVAGSGGRWPAAGRHDYQQRSVAVGHDDRLRERHHGQ